MGADNAIKRGRNSSKKISSIVDDFSMQNGITNAEAQLHPLEVIVFRSRLTNFNICSTHVTFELHKACRNRLAYVYRISCEIFFDKNGIDESSHTNGNGEWRKDPLLQ